MDPSDALDLLHAYDLLLLLAGAGLVAVSVLPRLLHDKPLSVPILMVAFGYVAFSLPLGLDPPDPIAQGALTKRITELGVILSLMTAGLAIDRRPGLRNWTATWRLLGITMPLTILGVALLGWWAGLVPAAAALLGAALAPTDPVQNKDIEVASPLEGADAAETESYDETASGEEDEVRFGLSTEAGINDGLAFPFTYLAISMAVAGAAPEAWLTGWLVVHVAYKLALGCVVGWALGKVLGLLLLRVPARSDLSRSITGLGSVGATLVVYGVTEYAGGYGFLAVFVAAVTMRNVDRENDRHRDLEGYVEGTERILMVLITTLFGGAIAGGLLEPVTWRHVVVALVVVLLLRPAAGLVALVRLGGGVPWRDRAAMAFFGVRGIATFYYLSYALEEAEFPGKEDLWAVAGLTVLVSVAIHGLTAAPTLQRLDRARERERTGT